MNRLGSERHRFQSRSANFIDGHGTDFGWQAAVQRGLARRILAQPGRNDIAHNAFIHLLGINFGTLHSFAHRDSAQLRGAQIGERALKLTDGSAHTGDDYDIFIFKLRHNGSAPEGIATLHYKM